MSMLGRYKQSGGFANLVKLVESCSGKKRQQLLNSILREDPRWAHLVHKRMMSYRDVFTWNAKIVSKIVSSLPVNQIAIALHGVDERMRIRILKDSIGADLSEQVQSVFSSISPSEEEITHAGQLIVTATRNLSEKNVIQILKIDPVFSLDDPNEQDLVRAQFGCECVLTVSPSLDMRRKTGSILAKIGYNAFEAINGEIAWNMLLQSKSSTVTAVFLDQRMPGLQGLELLRSIRKVQAFQYTAVFLLGEAESSPELLNSAISMGANGLISLPLSYEKTIEKLKETFPERQFPMSA